MEIIKSYKIPLNNKKRILTKLINIKIIIIFYAMQLNLYINIIFKKINSIII